MSSFFFPKLALTSLKKNKITYLPYLLACVGTIMLFYNMLALATNDGLTNMPGAESLSSILFLGTIVIGLFSAVFLFYTNSFLIKRRKKELGLFNILGMAKQHMARMLFYETLIISGTSLVLGLAGGMLLSRLMYLLLLKLMHFTVPLRFSVSWPSVMITAVVFTGIFLLAFLSNLWQIRLANPIALLKGGQVGEREPKTKWLLTVIGVLALGSGYAIALTVRSPLDALSLFFVAVLLVMIGTYALFTAGSITLLKILRRNKTFFYKTKHFISVSGMIYRMKQNAVGLANICILSTAVLVVVSTTISLYAGMTDVLHTRFQQDISVTCRDYDDARIETANRFMTENAAEAAASFDVTIVDPIHYRYIAMAAIRDDENFLVEPTQSYNTVGSSVLTIIPLDDYNAIEHQTIQLTDDEVLIYSIGRDYGGPSIRIGDRTYRVREELDHFKVEGKSDKVVVNSYYIIVKDMNAIKQLAKIYTPAGLSYCYAGDLAGTEQKIKEYCTYLQSQVTQNLPGATLESLHLSIGSFYALYGGFLFIGIFLGLVFLLATSLIVYYKQVSEGYDDKERFHIMQQVGISRPEIKNSIRSQIVLVFFLPLLTAVIHIAFAFPVITQLLAVFNLTNTRLFLICTLLTLFSFAGIYLIVYLLTARAYYKIVS